MLRPHDPGWPRSLWLPPVGGHSGGIAPGCAPEFPQIGKLMVSCRGQPSPTVPGLTDGVGEALEVREGPLTRRGARPLP